jgi:hypothetical protein
MLAPLPLVAKAHHPPSSSAMIMGSGTLASTTGLVNPVAPAVGVGAWAPVRDPHAAPVRPVKIIAAIS